MKVKKTVSAEARETSGEFFPSAGYQKERLVIFKKDRVGGRARVTIDEERVL